MLFPSYACLTLRVYAMYSTVVVSTEYRMTYALAFIGRC